MNSYGGQAVIEGIMMRSKHYMSIAVRLENGKIKTKFEKLKQSKLSNILFLRGVYNLYDMMRLGIGALNWSADQQMMEENEDEGSMFNTILIVLTSIISIIFAILLFKATPFFLSGWIIGNENLFLFNLIDGVIKLTLFILYILFLSIFNETKKIFQYHGAEHKVIGCLECKEKLTIKNCKKYKKEHKRCGTNFMFLVISVSILVYLLIPLRLVWYNNLLLRLAFLPIIASISYELLRFNDKYKNRITNLVSLPGLFIQKLTTKDPTDEQMEVGIKALELVLDLEDKHKETSKV